MVPDDTKWLIRSRFKELVAFWSKIDSIIDSSSYAEYSLGFPDASDEELESLYRWVRRTAEQYHCSILVAELAVADLRSEFGSMILA